MGLFLFIATEHLMALNIKNVEVERLAAELAAITGESKTEAIKRALLERRERIGLGLARGNREKQVLEFLREEVWPLVPEGEMGRCWSAEEEEAVLGYGEQGV